MLWSQLFSFFNVQVELVFILKHDLKWLHHQIPFQDSAVPKGSSFSLIKCMQRCMGKTVFIKNKLHFLGEERGVKEGAEHNQEDLIEPSVWYMCFWLPPPADGRTWQPGSSTCVWTGQNMWEACRGPRESEESTERTQPRMEASLGRSFRFREQQDEQLRDCWCLEFRQLRSKGERQKLEVLLLAIG